MRWDRCRAFAWWSSQASGPGPFAAMLLSDMGADVIRIDRKGGRTPSKGEVTYRGRSAVALDMKKPEASKPRSS